MTTPGDEGQRKPRVTVLCGFLGAGKTTLLNHLLKQAEGRRWAAVVNDVAAINIDAAVVRSGAETAAARDVVELGNGCVCCSSKDELAETIAELAASGRGGAAGAGGAAGGGRVYAHILVETTGVAEPRGVANLFTRKNPFGRTLGDFATLSALVSVIDAAAWLREWRACGGLAVRERAKPGGTRPVFELMLEQAECADVLVVNKADLVSAEEADELEGILRGLNPRAELMRTERGQVASEWLLDRARFDAKATLGGARWIRELNAVAPGAGVAGGLVKRPTAEGATHEARFGIRACVFQARRPFVREQLEGFVATALPGLLRAKGFFWTRDQPDEMQFLSVAGGVVRYETLNYWWAALVESGKARREERPAGVLAAWAEPFGDRRQELVFIGVGLDEGALRAGLEACLAEESAIR